MHHKKESQELIRTYSSMKTLQFLTAPADCEGGISLAQFSVATGIPPSSTHRIFQETQHCGFAIKDEVKKRHQAGLETRLLAIQLQKTNLPYEAARGEMACLNDLSLEIVHPIGEEDMEATYLAKPGAKSSAGLHSVVSERIPLHCTGGGKVIPARKSESWLENYLAYVKRERFISKTLVNAEDLRWELEVIRIQGYAVDNHEHHTDVVCIATSAFGVDNQVLAAIRIAAPDYRLSLEKAPSYSGEILRRAVRITEKLGWHYPIRVSEKRDEGGRLIRVNRRI